MTYGVVYSPFPRFGANVVCVYLFRHHAVIMFPYYSGFSFSCLLRSSCSPPFNRVEWTRTTENQNPYRLATTLRLMRLYSPDGEMIPPFFDYKTRKAAVVVGLRGYTPVWFLGGRGANLAMPGRRAATPTPPALKSH